eukprot:NODE_146_length_1795_cov_385.191294_g100_i0.p3 GENE.NODE_146_length_1795_cov_385.191294_g100_i0~~NODE_146_length_1795_cov_385.191294_g100_i0.p3  ORF type:complete len:120 (+),score=25.99 NODE_146_length_1795_cov_385.191294_g100_i0:128-487(+)
MGLLFVQFFPSPSRICLCAGCGVHIADIDQPSALTAPRVGIMGVNEPGKNYAKAGVINVDLGDPESKLLSSGQYTIRSVTCFRCGQYLGWTYDSAELVNKDREGTFMLMDRCFSGPYID